MFGFLNPVRHQPAYRRVYARCCQHQHLNYGLLALPYLSYEAIFLYLCTVDADPTPCALPDRVCCGLRAGGKLRQAPDAEVGRFCSAFSMILAATKLEDDVRDGRSLMARLYKWLLRCRVAAARHYFSALDSEFGERTDQLIRRHLAMEAGKQGVPLDNYTQPTAEAFGYIFGMMGDLPGVRAGKGTLTLLGRRVGAALIAFDCAYDWKQDRANGEFNPLPNEHAVQSALVYSKDQLTEAAQVCRRAFGPGCETAKVLDAVRESIAEEEEVPIREALRGLLQQWGLLRPKGVVQLNANGCDPGQSFGQACCACICVLGLIGSGCRSCTTCRHEVVVKERRC